MPLYEYVCRVCGEERDAFRTVVGRNKGPKCRNGHVMSRRYTAPREMSVPGIWNKVNRNWRETGEALPPSKSTVEGKVYGE